MDGSYLRQLRLSDFRNYSRLDLDLPPGQIVFFGPNGAGKTNLLEAISLLAPGRGLRRAKLDTIGRADGSAPWAVSAVLTTDFGEHRIGVGQVSDAPTRRIIRVDGSKSSGTALAGLMSVMWLTPAQDRLFTGPAGDRRKFLDRMALTQDPAHGMHVSAYERARAERNRLLSDGSRDSAWFSALEADLAGHGAKLARARTLVVSALREEIAERPEGAFPKALVALDGMAEDHFAAGLDLAGVREALRAAYEAGLDEARRAGRTLVGPHRTELIVTHAPKAMPAAACSTGEQKALLIGLVLAHARSVSKVTGTPPILLLDEVAAHLDADRRAALSQELSDTGAQTFVTGTDRSLFAEFAGALMVEVRDGMVGIAVD